jgi:hypothetical protein
MHIHGGNELRVMHFAAKDAVLHNEPLPLAIGRRDSGSTVRKRSIFSTSLRVIAIEKPKPLLAAGRVATFKNSAIF